LLFEGNNFPVRIRNKPSYIKAFCMEKRKSRENSKYLFQSGILIYIQ